MLHRPATPIRPYPGDADPAGLTRLLKTALLPSAQNCFQSKLIEIGYVSQIILRFGRSRRALMTRPETAGALDTVDEVTSGGAGPGPAASVHVPVRVGLRVVASAAFPIVLNSNVCALARLLAAKVVDLILGSSPRPPSDVSYCRHGDDMPLYPPGGLL